jgi:periplasmic protein CpxP/Spy
MKRTSLVILGGLLLGGLATSQGADPAPPANVQKPTLTTNAPGSRPPMRTRADYLAQRFKLTPEQKEKVQVVFDEETKKYGEMRTQTTLKPEERRAKYMAIREETNAKLKTIMTPEQWEQYSKPPQRQVPPVRNTNAVPAAPAAPATPPPAAPAK